MRGGGGEVDFPIRWLSPWACNASDRLAADVGAFRLHTDDGGVPKSAIAGGRRGGLRWEEEIGGRGLFYPQAVHVPNFFFFGSPRKAAKYHLRVGEVEIGLAIFGGVIAVALSLLQSCIFFFFEGEGGIPFPAPLPPSLPERIQTVPGTCSERIGWTCFLETSLPTTDFYVFFLVFPSPPLPQVFCILWRLLEEKRGIAPCAPVRNWFSMRVITEVLSRYVSS